MNPRLLKQSAAGCVGTFALIFIASGVIANKAFATSGRFPGVARAQGFSANCGRFLIKEPSKA